MSRNKFQSILWNLHLVDDSQNPRHGIPGHDTLAKLQPFIDMVENNFAHVYCPQQNVSIDEACCPFKGRLCFRVNNPAKPNQFHIKLFQLSESSSGYIIVFEVYTGKGTSCAADVANPIDKECSRTTKLVLGLLEEFKLLNKGHCVYMDNYYSSPELFEELYFRETYACGTVCTNRKGMPDCIKRINVKPLESAYLHNGPLLCLKWKRQKTKSNKKPVTLISTIHDAQELLTTKKDSMEIDFRNPKSFLNIPKTCPVLICQTFHMSMRKSMKWWRKLFFHIMNMILLNAYILNTKFGKT